MTTADQNLPGATVDVSPAPAAALPQTARMHRLGRYDIIAKLGQGGMAEVYLAMSRAEVGGIQKLVVLKVLHENLRSDEQFISMFMREAKIAVRLMHPNVVSTFTVGQEAGRHCIVMEYLEGVPLSALVKKARNWSVEERLPLLAAVLQALNGLHYVHEFCDYEGTHLRLVHRDFKPSNIFVTFDGQVKVLDFGVTKVTAEGMDATLGHTAKGTVKYMAPEILNTPVAVDRRADVYGAGMTIWDVVSGKNPWTGMTDFEILRGLMEGQLAAPLRGDEPPEGFPPAVFDVVKQATRFDVGTRYTDAMDLRSALTNAMAELGLSTGTDQLQAIIHDVFGDMRRSRKVAIGERLKALESLRDVEPQPWSTSYEGAVPFLGSGITGTQGTASDRLLAPGSSTHGLGGTTVQHPPRRNGLIFGLIGVAGLSVGLAFYLGAQSRNQALVESAALAPSSPKPPESETVEKASPPPAQPEASVKESGDASPESSPETKPALVTIDASVTPADAKLYLDDRVLAGNPTEITRADDGKVHTLVAQADGYERLELEVRFDRDQTLRLTLEESEDAKSSGSSRRSSSGRRRSVRKPAAKPSPKTEPISVVPASEPAPPPRPGDDLPRPRKKAMDIDTNIDL